MKFELAAIDASQNREPQPVTPAGLGKGSGLAQFAARLEVDPWTSTVFDVAIKSPQPGKPYEPSPTLDPTKPFELVAPVADYSRGSLPELN